MNKASTCLNGKTFKSMSEARKKTGVGFGVSSSTGAANNAFWAFVQKHYTFTVDKDGYHFTAKVAP